MPNAAYDPAAKRLIVISKKALAIATDPGTIYHYKLLLWSVLKTGFYPGGSHFDGNKLWNPKPRITRCPRKDEED